MNIAAHQKDTQYVTQITHYTDRLFSFRLTRPRALRFQSGEFVMIGLMGENDRPLLRAYSIASPAWDEELEFYSIKVPDGPLTSRLQHIRPGDEVILRPKPVGTLVHGTLRSGRRLFMIATGTGIAPFASLIRDPETYEHYDEVILTHTCRTHADLRYGSERVAALKDDPLVGEMQHKLRYLPTTTQEASPFEGRITHWIESGKLTQYLGGAGLNTKTDRVMICGSIGLNAAMKAILLEQGFIEGSHSTPGDFSLERAFVS